MGKTSLAINYPYLIGVYLAVNAVPDLFLFVDGPDCASFKAEYIQGRHDLNSTLIDCAGENRVVHPVVDVTSVVLDRTDDIKKILRKIDAVKQASAILCVSMPMTTITGTQYDAIIAAMDPPLSKPTMIVPSLSLSKDWLDGYSNSMESLAGGIEPTGVPDKGRAAIVGYFMDRNENDHRANIGELKRLLKGIGLETSTVWLSGEPVESLARVGEAGVIISMPHGREAAKILAQKTGAKLVETGAPIGFEASVSWLRAVAEATGREREAESLIDAELSDAVPRVKWTIGKIFFGRNLLFCGDPKYFESVHGFFTELGCEVETMVGVAKEHHLFPLPERLVLAGARCLFDQTREEFQEVSMTAADGEGPDIVISNDDGLNFLGGGAKPCAKVAFGFANYRKHAIYDAPFMGFRGAVWLVDEVAEAVMTANSQRLI